METQQATPGKSPPQFAIYRDLFGRPLRDCTRGLNPSSPPAIRSAGATAACIVVCGSAAEIQKELAAAKDDLANDRQKVAELNRRLIQERVRYEALVLRIMDEGTHKEFGASDPEDFLLSREIAWPGDPITRRMRAYYRSTAEHAPDEVVASGLAGVKLMAEVGNTGSELCRELLFQMILQGVSGQVVWRGVKAAQSAMQKPGGTERKALKKAVAAIAEAPRKRGAEQEDLWSCIKGLEEFARMGEGLMGLPPGREGELRAGLGDLIDRMKAKAATVEARAAGGKQSKKKEKRAKKEDRRKTQRDGGDGGGRGGRAAAPQQENSGGAGAGTEPVKAGAEPGAEPGSEVVTRTDAEPGSEVVPRTDAEPGSEVVTRTDAEPGSKVVPRTGSEPGSGVVPSTDAAPGSGVVSRTGSEPGSGVGTSTDVEPGSVVVPKAGAEPGAEPGSGVVPSTDAEPGSEVVLKAGAEPGSGVVPKSGAEPASATMNAAGETAGSEHAATTVAQTVQHQAQQPPAETLDPASSATAADDAAVTAGEDATAQAAATSTEQAAATSTEPAAATPTEQADATTAEQAAATSTEQADQEEQEEQEEEERWFRRVVGLVKQFMYPQEERALQEHVVMTLIGREPYHLTQFVRRIFDRMEEAHVPEAQLDEVDEWLRVVAHPDIERRWSDVYDFFVLAQLVDFREYLHFMFGCDLAELRPEHVSALEVAWNHWPVPRPVVPKPGGVSDEEWAEHRHLFEDQAFLLQELNAYFDKWEGLPVSARGAGMLWLSLSELLDRLQVQQDRIRGILGNEVDRL